MEMHDTCNVHSKPLHAADAFDSSSTNRNAAYAASQLIPPLEEVPKHVAEKIEAAFEDIADALLDERNQLTITLKIRPRASNGSNSSAHHPNATYHTVKTKQVCFPGKSAEEAWRFSMNGEIILVSTR